MESHVSVSRAHISQDDVSSLQQCLCVWVGCRMNPDEGRQSQKRGMKVNQHLRFQDVCVTPDAVQSLLTDNRLGSSTWCLATH